MRGLAHAAGATVLRVGESRPSAAGSAATERAVETVMVHTYCMVVAPLEAMHTPGGVFGAGWGWPPTVRCRGIASACAPSGTRER